MTNLETNAFPIGFLGLTKREYFAALAMQGLCAGVSGENAGMDNGINLCEASVIIADELLKQLEKCR